MRAVASRWICLRSIGARWIELRPEALRALGLCLIGLSLCVGSYARAQTPRGPAAVVLITMDTLRADHLGAYGYPRPTSPFLDRLSAAGIRFERAFSAMATTVPSHASLFTSRFPTQLGVRKNGDVLSDNAVTLAEHLAANDFETAAFVATRSHFKAGNLDQGFTVFEEPENAGVRPASQVVDAAIAWLGGLPSLDRVFLWVHVFDAHAPRSPTEAQLALVRPENAAALATHRNFLREAHFVDPESSLILLEQRTARSVRIEAQVLEYDAQIRSLDGELERLHAAIEAKRGGTEVLWVATSDHGEGLGNHGWLGHGKFVYNEQVRVPLILHFSSRAYAGSVVEEAVEHVDVWPTLLEHLGLEPPPGTALMGESLTRWYSRGKAVAVDGGSAFSERRDFVTDPRLEQPQLPLEVLNYEPGQAYSLQTRQWKYILRSAGDDEFFDLAADPYETRNVIAHQPERAAEFRARLVARIAAYQSEAEASGRVDRETAEQLRALGYVE